MAQNSKELGGVPFKSHLHIPEVHSVTIIHYFVNGRTKSCFEGNDYNHYKIIMVLYIMHDLFILGHM